MMKKNQTSGTPLLSNEMKEIKGGTSALPGRTLWYCQISPGDYAEVCYSMQPNIACDYVEDCGVIGTCPAGLDQCIY